MISDIGLGLERIARTSLRARFRAFLVATVWVMGAAVLGLLLQRLPHANLSVMFLVVVVIVAARHGLAASLYASILSFLIYNFFFTTPRFTFWVGEEGDLATLVFFIFVAALSGHMAARLREALARREIALNRVSNLYEFSHRMVRAATAQGVLNALKQHAGETFDASVVINIDSTYQVSSRNQAGQITDAAMIGQDRSGISMNRTEHGWRVELGTPSGRIGELVLGRENLSTEEKELLRTLADHAALAYERTRFAGDLREAQLEAETERLRSTLLTSVSHDLRTPLASIIGSATSLLEYDQSISQQDRLELLNSIADEAHRLNRYIQNLLDMTRLGRGDIKLHRDWVDLNDILASARRRLDKELKDFDVDIRVEPGAEMLYVHGALIEQALVNIIENATRFSPAQTRIMINARLEGESDIIVEVIDEGPGIPAEEREKIFKMFYTAIRQARVEQGTGLGLAICRSLIGAHGGRIEALPGPDGRGTCIRFSLPRVEQVNL